MEFNVSQKIPFPTNTVFTLVQDHLEELIPHLPNVDKLEALSRESKGKYKVRVINRWHAKAQIPSVVQKIIKPEMLTWLDTAEWDKKALTCRWEIEPSVFKDHIRCTGINYYKAEGKKNTLLETTGNLTISPEALSALPRLLRKNAAQQVEKFVVKLLGPNLLSLAEAATRYLQKNPS